MPARTFLIPHRVEKEIGKLPVNIQEKVKKAFGYIQENPVGGIKLQGRLGKYYKYRLGDYRIVYGFDSKESRVEVVKVEHRQGVYK